MSLNEIAKEVFRVAEKRQSNGANLNTDTMSMLKHTATEVIESTQAFANYDWFKNNWKDSDVERGIYKSIFEKELADIICCVLIIAEKENIDIDNAVIDVMTKNKKRAMGIGDKL